MVGVVCAVDDDDWIGRGVVVDLLVANFISVFFFRSLTQVKSKHTY